MEVSQAEISSEGKSAYQVNKKYFFGAILVPAIIEFLIIMMSVNTPDFFSYFYSTLDFVFYAFLLIVPVIFVLYFFLEYEKFKQGLILDNSGIAIGTKKISWDDINRVKVSRGGLTRILFGFFEFIMMLVSDSSYAFADKTGQRWQVLYFYDTNKKIGKLNRSHFGIKSLSVFKKELISKGVKFS